MKNQIIIALFALCCIGANAQPTTIITQKVTSTTTQDERTPRSGKSEKPVVQPIQQNATVTQVARRQLAERGFTVCTTNSQHGDIFANKDNTYFCYIDPVDGIFPAQPEEYAGCLVKIRSTPSRTTQPQPQQPQPQPQPTPVPETGFRIIEVLVHATPQNSIGDCPQKIVFTARISAVGGAGVVSYKWLRNDGASAPVETIRFDGPGSKTVETYWQLGGKGSTYTDFWQQLEVFDPKPFLSNKAFFTLTCK